MTRTTPRAEPDEKAATPATIDTAQLGAEQAESIVRPLLADGNDPVRVVLKTNGEVPDHYIDTLFSTLMRSAMATGGRRLAVEWLERLRLDEKVAERAHRAMAGTVNLQVRFGMLSPPLAVQTGCRAELLEHEQKDADAIARLAVHGIATDGEVRKMHQRLVKRIVKVVGEDTRPQTVDTQSNR